MSPSNLLNNAPVNYADVQPSEPKPFDDRQPKANTIIYKSTSMKRCWTDVFPDAKTHFNEQATWLNGPARGKSNRTEGVTRQ